MAQPGPEEQRAAPQHDLKPPAPTELDPPLQFDSETSVNRPVGSTPTSPISRKPVPFSQDKMLPPTPTQGKPVPPTYDEATSQLAPLSPAHTRIASAGSLSQMSDQPQGTWSNASSLPHTRSTSQEFVIIGQDETLESSAPTPPMHSPAFRQKPATTTTAAADLPQPQSAVFSSVESQPVENQPVESQPVESQPVESQPVENQPVEVEPVESEHVDFSAPHLSFEASRSARQASNGSAENVTRAAKTYPPLQYHHQQFVEGDGISSADMRDSRGTMQTSRSNSPASSVAGENMPPPRRHLTPSGNSHGRLSIVRPSSAYSSLSLPDGGNRKASPSGIPGSPGNRRVSSNHSPDSRRTSYVDLLNVPYPQPAPATGSFNNSHLRSAVGSNASLLSHKQTLEMYRTNAKKTNDPSIQYEFAVFMISAAQELGSGAGNTGMDGGTDSVPRRDLDSPYIDNSNPSASQAELLREARQILQRLSDRSYPFAQYYLADGYASGLFTKGKEDYDKAFPLFVAAGKHGHAEASYRAALSYEFGWGCRKDPAKAVQFYRQSASKNHPGAMLRLGKACLTGDMGLGNRYREGLKWLKRGTESADFQHNSAPYELGLLHETGYGDDVFQDETYAAQLFTQAADLGHPEASYRLGGAYEHGKLSCPRDPALSVHFYNGAAQHGHPAAMMALCAWYMVGAEPVLEKDEIEAYEWAKKAAERGLFAHMQQDRMVANQTQAWPRPNMPWATLRRWALAVKGIPSKPMSGMSKQQIKVTSVPSNGLPISERQLPEMPLCPRVAKKRPRKPSPTSHLGLEKTTTRKIRRTGTIRIASSCEAI